MIGRRKFFFSALGSTFAAMLARPAKALSADDWRSGYVLNSGVSDVGFADSIGAALSIGMRLAFDRSRNFREELEFRTIHRERAWHDYNVAGLGRFLLEESWSVQRRIKSRYTGNWGNWYNVVDIHKGKILHSDGGFVTAKDDMILATKE